ncbi:hypothetical protein M0R45_003071 [Rubus argutus]|uniref:Transmembrane protein n=1 Tax=Rubus argutus TaxID=59490 RepID=A0AAW1YDZ4_RUBAR
MSIFRSKKLLLFLSFSIFIALTSGSSHISHTFRATGTDTRRSLADETVQNSSLILAKERTRRKDPLDDFHKYTGGWNISNDHYWASVAWTAVPFFLIAGLWFVIFGLSLTLICFCYCCCPREPYGYSRTAYALSLIFLIFFTVAAIVGCIVLYTGQAKFHSSTTKTLKYVVNQADTTVENLRNLSDVQSNIDTTLTKLNSAATKLSDTTEKNSNRINDGLDSTRLALIVIAAVMLCLAFLGFLFSILGMQALVYFLVVVGWVLVAGTFILCGVFLLFHNVVADACVSMDEWVQHPTAHTALDDIIPCVDNATAQETSSRAKDSGPLLPLLCNPYNSDLTDRKCAPGEVDLQNATQVWKSYVCEVNSAGICTTPGRLTPIFYGQMEAAVNVSYGLYHYGPFLVNLQDCTFVRDTFTDISNRNCPGLRKHSSWIYIGLVMVSAAVMTSLIFWVIYARERRHRVYTKQFMAGGDHPGGFQGQDKGA